MPAKPVFLKPHTNPVQRLASRLLRIAGFSINQIASVVSFSPGVVIVVTKDASPENVQEVTLREVGAPEDNELYQALLHAAESFMQARMTLLNIGQPRGQ